MKNKVQSFNPVQGINAKAHRRENQFAGSYKLIHCSNNQPKEIADLRLYNSSSNSSNTACIWINDKGIYANGSGKAIGYGYHRPSAAVETAMNSAGIKLQHSISGVGNSAIESALLAIGRKLGYRNLHVIHSYA